MVSLVLFYPLACTGHLEANDDWTFEGQSVEAAAARDPRRPDRRHGESERAARSYKLLRQSGKVQEEVPPTGAAALFFNLLQSVALVLKIENFIKN